MATEIFAPNEKLRNDVLNLARDNPVRVEKLKDLNSSLDRTKLLLAQLQQPIAQLNAVITCIEQLTNEEDLVEQDDWNTWVTPFLEQLQRFLQEYHVTHGKFPDIFKSQVTKCTNELEKTHVERLTTEAVKEKLRIYSGGSEHTASKLRPTAKTEESSKSDSISTHLANGSSGNSEKTKKASNLNIALYNSLIGVGLGLGIIGAVALYVGEKKESNLLIKVAQATLVLGIISLAAALITRCLIPSTTMEEAQVTGAEYKTDKEISKA